jgi:hypothetical protein
MAAVALGTTVAVAPIGSTGQAQEDIETAITRRVNAYFEQMRARPFRGRLTGCGGWDCNDARITIQMPGKVRIEYDYGSTVLADGTDLITYNRTEELHRAPIDETDLSLLLAGQLGDEVEVDAVEEIGEGSGAMYTVEVSRGRRHMTLFFSKQPFRLAGWAVDGPRGGFRAQVRGLRAARNVPADTFRPLQFN